MKGLIKIFTIFTLGLISCSDDNEISIENDVQQKFIKVTEITTQGTTVIAEGYIEYIYGENGYLSQLTASGDYTKNYDYNSNNQIVKITFQDNSGSYFIDYNYQNGLIVSEIYSNGNTTNYSYNSNNQLSSLESNGDILSFNYDNDGNLIERIFDSQVIDSFEYDDKTNPFTLLAPENYNKIIFEGNHNMTFRQNGNRSIVYEYNSENLPLKSTYTDNGGFVQVREYFYED